LLDEQGTVLFIFHVGVTEMRVATNGPNLLGCERSFLILQIAQDNRSTFRRDQAGTSKSDALCRAGYHNNLAAKSIAHYVAPTERESPVMRL
jgi:hypothetical protein